MGAKFSTSPENDEANFVTPTNYGPSNNNYVPQIRTRARGRSYKQPSTNIVEPSIPDTKLSTDGSVGGLPLKDANPNGDIIFHSSTKLREYSESSKQSNDLVC